MVQLGRVSVPEPVTEPGRLGHSQAPAVPFSLWLKVVRSESALNTAHGMGSSHEKIFVVVVFQKKGKEGTG